MNFDIELEPDAGAALQEIPPAAWFDQVHFSNVSSPRHPNGDEFDEINDYKTQFVGDWLQQTVPGTRVLDAFAANGRFGFHALDLGAEHVTALEFSADRIDAGTMVAKITGQEDRISFMQLDVYDITRTIETQFDVSLCLGGLYHVADPPYILRQLRAVTTDWLIVQTSDILPRRGNRAHFVVREDMVAEGFTSIRGGEGVWFVTVECFRQMLAHGHFQIVDERRPPKKLRQRFPWYAALCRPI